MSKKFSQFTSQNTVSDNDYINITGATNRRIVWPDFLDNIYDRIVTPFIYPTIVSLQEAPLRADEDDPVYVRVEETEYRLYKITNIAPGASDIVLDNGNTATAKTEYRDIGFVVGPETSSIGALATYDNETGTLLAEGPSPSTVGVNLIEFPDSSTDGYFRKKNDNTLELITGDQLKVNLSLNNVDNTSDANKPISIATQNALDLKAPLASPALTGNPTAPTQPAGTSDTTLANTAYVQGELTDRIQSVATIADLRALTGLTDGQIISVRVHSVGIQGGGDFVVDSTLTELDDNGVFIITGGGQRLYRRDALSLPDAQAIWWGADRTVADNLPALNTARDFCIKYGKRLLLQSTRVDSSTRGYIEISAPWQVPGALSIVGVGEDTAIRKNNDAVGSGSNDAPERAGIVDSYAVDAVLILTHEDNAFPFDAHWEGFRLYGNGTGIGSYRPRAARMEVIDVSCHDVEYQDVTFTSFLSYFRKFMGFSPSGTLISGFDWRDDGSAGGTGTSCMFDQCYVFGAIEAPYDIYGLNYSTFNSPAADAYGDVGTSTYAYKLSSCVGMTFNSPGAESSVEGGMFLLENSTVTINAPKTFSLNVTNGQANILANSGCDVVVNAPEFADFATTSGTTYNISAPTASEITVVNGRMSANATAIFNGDVHWERSMQNLISGNRGDADISLTAGTDHGTQRYASTLTANRTVTLSTTGAWKGARFRVSRTAATPGTFTLSVGGLATIPIDSRGFVDVEYNGTAWVLTAFSVFV